MPSKQKILGEVVADHPLPSSTFRSEREAYIWGVKTIQSVVARIHESSMSLRVVPLERKNALERVRVSIRVSSSTYFYSLVMKGKNKVKVVRLVDQEQKVTLYF